MNCKLGLAAHESAKNGSNHAKHSTPCPYHSGLSIHPESSDTAPAYRLATDDLLQQQLHSGQGRRHEIPSNFSSGGRVVEELAALILEA